MAPARFVTDASLALVARRLRALGFDVVTHRGARLEELLAIARSEGRAVLTLSARRTAAMRDLEVITLPRDAAAAVRSIAEGHEPASPPFRRCLACNTALQSRSSFEARGEVPGRVTRQGGPLTYCPSCGQWFWVGTHVEALCRWLSATLDRPIAPPTTHAGEDA